MSETVSEWVSEWKQEGIIHTGNDEDIRGVSVAGGQVYWGHAVTTAGRSRVATGNQQHTDAPVAADLACFLEQSLPLWGFQYVFPELRQKLFQLSWVVRLDGPEGQR